MSEVQFGTPERSNVSESVVEAVAESEAVDPIELAPPLYEVIDTDALDQLFAPSTTQDRMDGQVAFSYNGYDIQVSGDGYVSVEDQGE